MNRLWSRLPTNQLLAVLAGTFLALLPISPLLGETEVLILEDFQSKDDGGFPVGWEAQRNKTALEAYKVKQEGGEAFLSAQRATQRVFKRIAWDPRRLPIVTWKWRLKAEPPQGADPVAAVYLSLDTDLLVIPVATKYVWSSNKPKGTITEGGLFGASEIVVRTGSQPVGEWVEERVNAYEDFKRIHQHEPAEETWGISLLAGPGVEIDFGTLTAFAGEHRGGG